jgi:hypothetical protein
VGEPGAENLVVGSFQGGVVLLKDVAVFVIPRDLMLELEDSGSLGVRRWS